MVESEVTGGTVQRPWRDFLRMKIYLRPYAWRLAFMMAISLVASALGLAQPYLSKYLVDNALLRRDLHALWIAAAAMLAATVAGFVLSYVSGYGYMRLSSEMLFDMRMDVYSHLHTLSPRFYARARLGDLVSRLNGDVAELQRISADSVLSLLSNLVFFIGSLFMMIWLSWRLFLVGIVLIPISITLFRYYQEHIIRLTRELREQSAAIGTLFVETLIGVRLVACFNASDYELDRFRKRNDSFVDTLLRFQSTSLMGRSLPGTILTVATIAVFLYGGGQVIAGRLSIGKLVAFMAYHARLLTPVQGLLGLSASLSSARVSLSRVLDLLDTPAEVVEARNSLPVLRVERGIAFHSVALTHEGRVVLDDICFEIPAGRFSVLVGPSGSGKSSIADLAVRLLDPDSGAVTLDGVDLRRLRLNDLRRAVVLIDQAPHLMHGSLLENIAYGNRRAARIDVEQAAQAVGLGPLIGRLAAGLDAVVGERGLTLSTGERQRVALARAFLADPSVLILDEPSAALDTDGELDLIENLRRQFAGKTVLAITHKPALALAADHVLRLKQGRLVAEGVAA